MKNAYDWLAHSITPGVDVLQYNGEQHLSSRDGQNSSKETKLRADYQTASGVSVAAIARAPMPEAAAVMLAGVSCTLAV